MDVARLERSLQWAIDNELPCSELVAMLRPLVSHTQATEPRGRLVRLELAERLLFTRQACERAWEIAALTRQVLLHEAEPSIRARAQGALGLALTLLGHYQLARRAYFAGLSEDPAHPVLAHNLGHLLAVAFNDPTAGLPWLGLAYRALNDDREVAASYAHALVRSGQLERAAEVLKRSEGAARSRQLIDRWLSASVG